MACLATEDDDGEMAAKQSSRVQVTKGLKSDNPPNPAPTEDLNEW
jgi:hypothetical protein